jgi:outer membrane biosynthesis protein TonB
VGIACRRLLSTFVAAVICGSSLVAGPGVIPPKPLSQPAPAYPADAIKAKAEGVVVVDVVVGGDGAVTDARLKSGFDSVHGGDDAALQAIRG